MKKTRKAQTEILGLAFIVILISIGIFLLYTFSEPTEKFHKGFADSQTATNLLISLAKTTVPACRNYDIGDLIANCAESNGRWNSLNRGDMSICGGMPTCIAANKTMNSIFEKTLKKEYDYDFRVYIFGEDKEDKSQWIFHHSTSAACTAKNIPGTKPGNYGIKFGANKDLMLRLKVCPV